MDDEHKDNTIDVTKDFINLVNIANNALMNAADREVINTNLMALKDVINNSNGKVVG